MRKKVTATMRAAGMAMRKEKVIAITMATHRMMRREVTATPMAIHRVVRKAQALPSTSNVMVIGMGEAAEGAATLSLPQAPWEALPTAQGDMRGYHATQCHVMPSADNESRILQGGERV